MPGVLLSSAWRMIPHTQDSPRCLKFYWFCALEYCVHYCSTQMLCQMYTAMSYMICQTGHLSCHIITDCCREAEIGRQVNLVALYCPGAAVCHLPPGSHVHLDPGTTQPMASQPTPAHPIQLASLPQLGTASSWGVGAGNAGDYAHQQPWAEPAAATQGPCHSCGRQGCSQRHRCR